MFAVNTWSDLTWMQSLNLGPSGSRPAGSLLFFEWWLFHPKLSNFSLPEHSTAKLEIYITPAEEFHNLLLSSVSTTRWCYNQGKCVLDCNSHIYFVAHLKTLYPLTELCWIWWYRPCPFPSTVFFHKFAKCHKHTFFNSSHAISPICTKLCTQHLCQ